MIDPPSKFLKESFSHSHVIDIFLTFMYINSGRGILVLCSESYNFRRCIKMTILIAIQKPCCHNPVCWSKFNRKQNNKPDLRL